MYFAFSKFKMIVVVMLALVVLGLAVATMAYKNAHFGDTQLHIAFFRDVARALGGVRYRIEFDLRRAVAASPAPERGGASAIPIIVYHTVTNRPGSESITPELFAAQLERLAESGWTTVTLPQLEQYLRGETSLPKKSFVITFDDGAKDSYYPVDPVLAALHMRAVSFIIPKYSDEDGSHYYLSHGEIHDMLDSGRWEIGSHTFDSHHLDVIDPAGRLGPVLPNRLYFKDEQRMETEAEYETRIESDLRLAKSTLQSTFKVPITAFAYPFGEYGQLSDDYPDAIAVVGRIAAAHHTIAFYQTWLGEGFSYNYPEPGVKGMIQAKRIEAPLSGAPEDLLHIFERGYPKDVPYSDSFIDDAGWFSTWGAYRVQAHTLILKAEGTETGNATILDGTGHWKDYSVRAEVESPGGASVYLWVRYKDESDNVGCNFGNGFLHAEETVNGVRHTIVGTREPSIQVPDGGFVVEARVTGRTVTCTINEHSVTSEYVDSSLDRGGIGFKTWSPVPGLATLKVTNITVLPIE